MKRLIKKKVSIFGKEVSVLLIALLAIGVVSAALVGYLSNSLTGTMNVESPFSLTLSGGSPGIIISDTEFLIPTNESFKFHGMQFGLKNNAGSSINAVIQMNISGNNPSSDFSDSPDIGEEFELFRVGLAIPNPWCGEMNGTHDGYCWWDVSQDNEFVDVIGGVYWVQFGDKNQLAPIPGGSTLFGVIEIQFKTDIMPDEYTFKIEAVNPDNAKDLV